LAQERPVLETLERHGYAGRGSPVFIQSFDPANLRQLREMTPLPLVQLLEHEIGDVARIAQYAHCIGIAKPLATPTSVAEAHAQGLAVHAWTFRAENEFLPDELKVGKSPAAHGDLRGEIARYLALGIDGFFTDFPAIGVAVRDAWAEGAAGKRPRG
jgi:glycerophosphoryl diester phosphodiesterase